MFSRAAKAPPAPRIDGKRPSGLSFIGPEVTVSGDVATAAQLHVDGRIEGDVRCATLCQGRTGTIAGSIVAEQARLAGLVEGTVSAQTVVLEETARITGDVSYETISIAAGAQVEGRLSRRAADPGKADPRPALIATPLEPEALAPPASAHELFPPEEKKRAAG